MLLLHQGAASSVALLPPLDIDLTGCWMMGASNGRRVPPGCGTAPLDGGDGLLYLSQAASGGSVDACLSQFCYRPAIGLLTNTSSGAGMLKLQTLTGKGNCSSKTHPSFPVDGLLEYFNFIIPRGWPSDGNKTRGTNVSATDLSGVFVNNDNPAGTAGGIFLTRHVDPAACDRMRGLPDCSAVPPEHASGPSGRRGDHHNSGVGGAAEGEAGESSSRRPTTTPKGSSVSYDHENINIADTTPACAAALRADCKAEEGAGRACMRCLEEPTHHADIRRAGCTPPDVQRFCGTGPAPAPAPPPSPLPPPDVRPHNATGCYIFGGSAGHTP
jgi:hypothetical protein